MDGFQLRDEAVRDRIRLVEEFLDPRMLRESLLIQPMLILVSHRGSARTKVRYHFKATIWHIPYLLVYSYLPDIILMMNRGLRRLTVGFAGIFQGLVVEICID